MMFRPFEIMSRCLRALAFLFFRPRDVVDWQARVIAKTLRKVFAIPENVSPIAVIRGTGWEKALTFEGESLCSYERFWFLRGLEYAPGHSPFFRYGLLDGVPTLTLARIHANQEVATPGARLMWHAILKALHLLGVRTLISTHGVGGFKSKGLEVGEIIVINEFLPPDGFNPGLFTAQHCSPGRVLHPYLRGSAEGLMQEVGLKVLHGNAAFFEGPQFEEGLVKKRMAGDGAHCATMSGYPEAAIWSSFCDPALPTDQQPRMVAMAVVTNLDFEPDGALVRHEHTDNVSAAEAVAAQLGRGLTLLVKRASIA